MASISLIVMSLLCILTGVYLTLRGASLLGVSIMAAGIALPLAMFAAINNQEELNYD
jgi:type IV secretory pathway VirB3-like protein